ncbi:nucleotidyltransferase domain-containing protein [Compostibacter hankyongensis]|uniref:Polymerase beta nucleotidyltransferase domain-containing protein n=1 Tax=Compostibacter hankyongensis TaxID=1007089 RepID=A0ABP8FVM2_9BACT
MVNIVKNNLDAIIQTCKELQVSSLYLFGSATREKDFNQESDLDFLYSFKKDETGLPQTTYDYFDLLFRLEKILDKKVDLVAEERILNKYFLETVNKEKVKLYEA